MLPGFRFLFATILLSVSVLVFGLGAAALLRAAHDNFAGLPSAKIMREAAVAHDQENRKATLAMLRVEMIAEQQENVEKMSTARTADMAPQQSDSVPASQEPVAQESIAVSQPEIAAGDAKSESNADVLVLKNPVANELAPDRAANDTSAPPDVAHEPHVAQIDTASASAVMGPQARVDAKIADPKAQASDGPTSAAMIETQSRTVDVSKVEPDTATNLARADAAAAAKPSAMQIAALAVQSEAEVDQISPQRADAAPDVMSKPELLSTLKLVTQSLRLEAASRAADKSRELAAKQARVHHAQLLRRRMAFRARAVAANQQQAPQQQQSPSAVR